MIKNMDLWIRSQDKSSLRIVSNINIIHEDGKMFICNYMGIANIKLGTYKTEQRALEILDEIENHLINSSFARKTNGLGEVKDIIPNPLFIYEMPKE